MRRSNFQNKRSISHFTVSNPNESSISVCDLVQVTRDYLNSNYSGLFNISCSIDSYESISICEDYFIKLFKQIVDNSRLESLVNVNISCNSDKFTLSITFQDFKDAAPSFYREIIRIGRSAGLDVYRSGTEFLFIKAVEKSQVITVFTKPLARIQLEKLFKEIFEKNI